MSSACILFRRSALEQVGGYEPRLFLYGEDVELSYRLRDHGYVLRYCVDAVCWHYTYETANELKPAQFFGSTVANVLLRLRYGTPGEIFGGLSMYFGLLLIPLPITGRLKGLSAGLGKSRGTVFIFCVLGRNQTSSLLSGGGITNCRGRVRFSCLAHCQRTLPS